MTPRLPPRRPAFVDGHSGCPPRLSPPARIPRSICVLTLAALTACAGAEIDSTAGAPSIFEFRIVHDEAAPGRDIHVFEGDTLFLAPAGLTDEDMSSVQPMARPTGLLLRIELTPAGGERLATLTRENIGRRMAVLIHGVVHSAPIIRSEIGNLGQVSLAIPGLQAESLSREVERRWP